MRKLLFRMSAASVILILFQFLNPSVAVERTDYFKVLSKEDVKKFRDWSWQDVSIQCSACGDTNGDADYWFNQGLSFEMESKGYSETVWDGVINERIYINIWNKLDTSSKCAFAAFSNAYRLDESYRVRAYVHIATISCYAYDFESAKYFSTLACERGDQNGCDIYKLAIENKKQWFGNIQIFKIGPYGVHY